MCHEDHIVKIKNIYIEDLFKIKGYKYGQEGEHEEVKWGGIDLPQVFFPLITTKYVYIYKVLMGIGCTSDYRSIYHWH